MHLFFDTVWKLHIGEIPEKPNFGGRSALTKEEGDLRMKYLQAIASIKQNALTVGNPEVIKSKLDSLEWVGRLDKADVYKWPGGYETKEIQDIVNWDYPVSTITGTSVLTRKTVAILTLPEEKKNTMENKEVINNDKEFLNWIYERMICVHGEKDLYDYMINFKSIIDRIGSVAAPKEEESKGAMHLRHKLELGKEIDVLRQQLKKREEALKELLSIVDKSHELFLNGKDWAIIERARKTLNKEF